MLAGAALLDPISSHVAWRASVLSDTDADLQALVALLTTTGASAALASLHSTAAPPALLGCQGLDAEAAETLLLLLDKEVMFDRRRRGEHASIRITSANGDGEVISLAAHAFPVHRDTVVLLALKTPSMHEPPPAWIEAYLELWWRRRCEREWSDGLRGALDFIDLGVVLLDAETNIRFANRPAERLLNVGDGVRRLGASLSATSFEDAVRLQVAIGLGVQPPAKGRSTSPRLTLRRAKGRPIVAAVAAATKPPRHACDPAAIVYLLDPDVDVERLLGPVCNDYGLTIAEAQIARSIVAGATLAEAAAGQRIRLDTARSYLKQVFAKTSTHRQAELVRIMLSSVLRAGPGLAPTS